MANNKTDLSAFTPLIMPLVIGGVMLVGGKKLFDFFGITADKDDKQREQENTASLNADYWRPNYYKELLASKQYQSIMITPVAIADALAKQIYDAKGLLNDKEAQIYAAFNQLHYLTQVSFLADRFNTLYKKDLRSWLYVPDTWFTGGILNEKEFNTVVQIINKYKSGASK